MAVHISGSCGIFFHEQHEPKCRVPVKIIPVQAFAPEKSKPFIKLHCSTVGDFSFQRDLFKMLPG